MAYYSKIEEVDRIYIFFAGLNPKFDIAHGRTLGQRPLPSLMDVCYKVRLKEERTSVMSSLIEHSEVCSYIFIKHLNFYKVTAINSLNTMQTES